MRKSALSALIGVDVVGLLVGTSGIGAQAAGKPTPPTAKTQAQKLVYTCPMHPEVRQDEPGKCPKCGMFLEAKAKLKTGEKLTYTCPMHPQVKQDRPGKCPKCGRFLQAKIVKPQRKVKSPKIR